MAEKFVRNITDTNTGGNKLNKNNNPKEPLYTNIQNDILSDNEDVYIRNQNEYVCLTDNVKEVETTSNIIGTENTDKNTVELQPQVATKTDAETGTSNGKIMTPLQTKNAIDYNNENVIPGLVKEHETETEIVSKSDNLTVTRKSKNNFELEVEQNADIDLSDYATKDYVNNEIETHETEIVSKSNNLRVTKKSKNNFELTSVVKGSYNASISPDINIIDVGNYENVSLVLSPSAISANVNNIEIDLINHKNNHLIIPLFIKGDYVTFEPTTINLVIYDVPLPIAINHNKDYLYGYILINEMKTVNFFSIIGNDGGPR